MFSTEIQEPVMAWIMALRISWGACIAKGARRLPIMVRIEFSIESDICEAAVSVRRKASASNATFSATCGGKSAQCLAERVATSLPGKPWYAISVFFLLTPSFLFRDKFLFIFFAKMNP
jgi:hypothetical protein